MSYFSQTALDPISSDDDVIDSRVVVARIDYLADLRDDEETGLTEDEDEELAALVALAEQGETLEDWAYGVALVRDSYFKTYAQDYAEEIGAIDSDAHWPNNHIDWDEAAEELQQNYTSLTFDGVHYWAR